MNTLSASTSEPNLVETYMTFIGTHEQDNSDGIAALPEGDIFRASMRIGQACIEGLDDQKAAIQTLQATRQELETSAPAAAAHEVRMLVGLTYLFENREELEVHVPILGWMHKQAADALLSSMLLASRLRRQGTQDQEERELLRRAAGARAERRTLATLARLTDTSTLALPALPHHNRAPTRSKNFDVALVAAIDGNADVYRLQSKSDCFGQCLRWTDERDIARHQDVFEGLRNRYRPDITLISGCCDFQMDDGERPRPGRCDRLLVEESDQKTSPEDNRALDELSARLLELATTPGETTGRSGRHGTLGKPQKTP